ncbi:MAG: alpha-ketoacid dehydrogenase subunit beta [Nanoarchaeota archaeon]|nr:alpha-ketoacid dehydrogenase subunit beta [Nanoarchaeota archaeon]
MAELNMVDAINLALKQEMKRDKNVILLGEDVGKEGGVFRVTAGLQKLYGKDRVYDTPLSENGIVGTSIGMAVRGLRPVAEIQFSGFVYPAFQQIVSHASRIRNRSRGRFNCPLVIRMPYSGGIRALEHHSESMESLFMHIPGLKVVIPSNPYDAKGLLTSAIRDDDPVIFMEPKRVYRAIKNEVPEDDYTIPIGKAKVVKEGNNVTIIAYGAMLREAQKAIDAVEKENVSCELIDLRTIKPMDNETIFNSVKKTGRCVIVHEGPRTGGVGAEIIARINDHMLLELEAPVERVTGFDTVFPYFQNENHYLPEEHRIVNAIKKVVEF